MARERELEALELRKAGKSYAEIGAELGISMQAAHKTVRRVLERLIKLADEEAKHVRRLELERLDKLLDGLWEKAKGGDFFAVDRALRIMQRRAELLGLDLPKGSGAAPAENPDLSTTYQLWISRKPDVAG